MPCDGHYLIHTPTDPYKMAAAADSARPSPRPRSPPTQPTQEDTPMLKEGDRAPDFTVNTDGGGTIKLSELRGRPVVLYFYPKDDTPGCTKEACGFRDATPDFQGIDAEILGVSKDSIAKHDRFKAKYELPFRLAADETGEICEAYGTWIEKSMYGRQYMGIDRATFLVDRDGVVRRIWRKVKVPGHVDEVLAAAKAL
jgi:peroxiredoxin Q/BCP